jgi:glycosyltransferase involved in cell wall biosynthesis
MVRFEGAVEPKRALRYCEESDALVLLSAHEGWPKALTEGLAFGLVCVATPISVVPQMLADNRGVLVPQADPHAVARVFVEISRDPALYRSMGLKASLWACQYSREKLQLSIRDLLARRWHVPMEISRPHAEAMNS